jgi:dihydropteroate synthase
MVDPGLGFAKTTTHNLELLRALPHLSSFPILVGASRKRFIGELLPHRQGQTAGDAASRDWGTAATTAAAVAGGAAAVRVHNVAANVDVARVADAVWKAVD